MPRKPPRRKRYGGSTYVPPAAPTTTPKHGGRTIKPGDPFYHPHFEGKLYGSHLWFDSVEEYLKYIELNSIGASDQVSRECGRGIDWDFGVEWSGACKLAREGWSEGAEKVERLLDKVEGHITKLLPQQRNVLRPAMVGGRVSVQAYLAGHPKQFLTLKREAATCKTVTMAVSCSISCGVSAEANMRRGVAIAAAVRALEQRRVRVELVSIKCNTDYDQSITAGACVVKRAQDKLQSDMVAFCLAHSAFPRRFGFAFQESSSKITGKPVPSGYGLPTTYEIPGAINIPTKPVYNDEEMEAFALEIIKGIIDVK